MSSEIATRTTRRPAPDHLHLPDEPVVDDGPRLRLRVVATEVLLIAVAALDVAPWSGSHLSWTGKVYAALSVAGFLLRRRWPLVTWLCGLPALVYSLVVITPVMTVYFATRRTRHRWVMAAVTVLTFVGYVWAALLQGIADAGRVAELQSVVSAALFAGAPTALALALRARHALDRRLRQMVAMRTREQSLLTYTAVADERARLAREMHDVVSHQVSLIAVRAGALRMTSSDPGAKDAAATIHRLASQTLDELRVMVGALRGTADDELTPQPRLADIPALVAACGLTVRLTDELPSDQTWSTQAQRAVYRTVQEGLTNVRKHAHGATADVRLSAQGRTLFVLVRDSGTTRATAAPAGAVNPAALPTGGHGLLGLRERAELLDGRLTTSRNSDGGFDLRMEISDPRA